MFLLYYQYVPIENPSKMCKWQIQLCQELGLNGRIRVSKEGINGTLSGEDANVESYICAMDACDELNMNGKIDWKKSGLVQNLRSHEEQYFQTLSVKVTKEVVSLDLTEKEETILKTIPRGEHLSPLEFHAALERYATSSNDTIASNDGIKNEVVMLDVRNIYETRIGKFDVNGSIEVIDPLTRKFSDVKGFIDANLERLKEKSVFMYCTGGVRCETASSYLKMKGVTDVYQLRGGIHAYMEAFPDGSGYFRGKNFVYDPRIAGDTCMGLYFSFLIVTFIISLILFKTLNSSTSNVQRNNWQMPVLP